MFLNFQEPLDFDEYYYNLTDANLTPDESPKWSKLYSFREAYNVNSLSALDLGILVEKMKDDVYYMEQYSR